jgi:hypothetical protein
MISQFYVPIIHISYLQYWCLMLAIILAKTCSIIDNKILSQPVAVIDCPVKFSHITQLDVQSYS